MIKIMLLKKVFETGQPLFKEGDPGLETYLIRDGYVTIWKDEGGQRVDIATRGPGDIIGEMSLIDDRPRSANVTAKGRVEVEVITRNELKELLIHTPEPIQRILHQVFQRLRETNDLAAMSLGR